MKQQFLRLRDETQKIANNFSKISSEKAKLESDLKEKIEDLEKKESQQGQEIEERYFEVENLKGKIILWEQAVSNNVQNEQL